MLQNKLIDFSRRFWLEWVQIIFSFFYSDISYPMTQDWQLAA